MINKHAKMIAFSEHFVGDFVTEFKQPGWEIIDYADRNNWTSDYYWQVNVKKWSKEDPIYDYILSKNKPFIVQELSTFRQNSYQSNKDKGSTWYYTVGWYHFMRNGKFNNINSPNDRWLHIQKEQQIKVKPWRWDKNNILFCLQKKSDSTLNSLYDSWPDYGKWVYAVTNILREAYPDMHIMLRPHLKTGASSFKKAKSEIENVSISKRWADRVFYEGGVGLQKDFNEAKFVVSYNSNVLTQSVLQGIPSICFDQNAMAAPVCLKPKIINEPRFLANPEIYLPTDDVKQQWLNDLAYTQWTLDEIKNGQAWNHLKHAINAS